MPGVVPQDICDAVLQQLRGSPCAQLFGDTWDPATELGIQKFYADWSDSSAYPLAIVTEPGESYEFMTAGPGDNIPYLAQGIVGVTVYAQDRKQARTLGEAVGRALNDAPLAWVGGRLMGFRMASAAFIPNPPSGPGVPTVFIRQITFATSTQGSL